MGKSNYTYINAKGISVNGVPPVPAGEPVTNINDIDVSGGIAVNGVTVYGKAPADRTLATGFGWLSTSVLRLGGTLVAGVGGGSVGATFSVASYGAVADSDGATSGSGTNNVSAFNQAIAAASVSGGTVVVPAGHYRLATAALVVAASNVRIQGPGHLFFDSQDVTSFGRLIFDGGATSGEITNVSASNLVISNVAGVAVTGPGYGYDGSACLLIFRGCANFLAENVEAYYSPNYAISATRSRDGAIRGCYSHDCIADGAHVQDGSARVIVENNTVLRCGDDGVGVGYWGAISKDTIIRNNRLTVLGSSGIGIYGSTDGVTVTGNIIEDTWTNGIKIHAMSNTGQFNDLLGTVRLDGNQMRGAGMRSTQGYARSQDVAVGIYVYTAGSIIAGVAAGGTVNDLVINNNTLKDTRSSFVVVDSSGGGAVTSMAVTGNTFDSIATTGGGGNASSGGGISKSPPDTSYPGILIGNSVSAGVVTGNTVKGAVGTPIVNTAVSAITSGNTIVTPTPTVIAADTFTHADVATTTAGPGNTATGNLPILMARNSDGSYKGTGGILGNRMVFGAGGSYPSAIVNAGTTTADITISATGSEHTAVLVGSNLGTGTCFIFLPQDGALYARDNGPPISGATASFTAVSAGTHTYRLRKTASQVAAYVDGSLSPIATVNIPFGFAQGTYVGWSVSEASNSGASGFTNLSILEAK